MLPIFTSQAVGGAEDPNSGICLDRSCTCWGSHSDVCQVMGFLMKETPRLESRGRCPKLLAHLTLDFLRLVLGCHCLAPGASMLGGWSPASTLCDSLAAPCRMGSREALRTKIVSPLEVHPCPVYRYAGLAFVQGSTAREPVPGDSPSSPRAALLRSIRHTNTSRPTLIIRRF